MRGEEPRAITARLIDERIAWVDEELRVVLMERQGEPAVYGMLRYHLGWADADGNVLDAGTARRLGGKRLRGVLAILACEACGGEGRVAVPAGTAVELIHNFSLIHDDIEDGDAERRHRPTVWSIWGVPQAINAGSAMQALVNRGVLRLEERGVPAASALGVMRELTDGIVRMTEGQCLDMGFQDQTDVDAAAYFVMTEGKTAALLAAALGSGALVANASSQRLGSLRAFGRAFGLAFQARDDYLGVWGDPATTGKPVGSDIERGKRSLPVVIALSRAAVPDALRHRLKARDVPAVMSAMEDCGVRAEVEATVARLTDEALGHLAAVGEASAAGRALESIARSALGRMK